jgi:transcriptional regulator with XRE-family HTH domain
MLQTIDSIHRQRLKLLVAEAGSQRALAERIGKAPSQISQWINGAKHSRTGQPRSMDRSTAREIERRYPKPEGWMDSPLPGGAGDPGDLDPSLDVERLAAWLQSLPETSRSQFGTAVMDLARFPDSQRARDQVSLVLTRSKASS